MLRGKWEGFVQKVSLLTPWTADPTVSFAVVTGFDRSARVEGTGAARQLWALSESAICHFGHLWRALEYH